jgi:hypothetical protein
MAELSLSQAAKQAGKSKSTIGRAIYSGRLSARKNQDGTFSIDPSELFRAFPKGGPGTTTSGTDGTIRNPTDGTLGTGANPDEIKALREELAKAVQQAAAAAAIAEERAETIADLRIRLDREGEERRKLTAILTDQTRQSEPDPAAPAVPPAPRSWWRRFLG